MITLRANSVHLSPSGRFSTHLGHDGIYLAPLAGRGRIASPDAIRVRGYRSHRARSWRAGPLLTPPVRPPLTPTLSP
ncbi:protein of unknown function [Bradyrhizobium sp. ORS 285]|nr:protein of unknown function [Bradyrhizobium sp. ORS 285]